MSYIVLARKWRPRHFDEVVGQEHVARTLSNAIAQNRVAHAFLFCGPRGVGKTSSARILAKALNCASGPTDKPCYECASCQEISRGSSVDVFEIDGASNRGVNEIRELREGVRYAPNRDRHKIYIIDEVHMLTTEAFNALLKTLEEPPGHVKFIFATTEPQKIPVTILSRCQRFDFKRVSIRRITEHLSSICASENIPADPSALSLIARQADGGRRDALSLTDQVISFSSGHITEDKVAEILGVASRELLFRLSHALLYGHVEVALDILDQISAAGHDLMQFAAALVGHLRDLTVVKVTGQADKMTDLTPQELDVALEQVSPVDPSVLHRMFGLMVQSADSMSRSGFPRLIFEMTLVKLSAIEPLMPIDLLIKRLEALESGLLIGDDPDGGGSPPPPGGGGPPRGGHEPPGHRAAPARPSEAAPRAQARPEPPHQHPEPPRALAPQALTPHVVALPNEVGNIVPFPTQAPRSAPPSPQIPAAPPAPAVKIAEPSDAFPRRDDPAPRGDVADAPSLFADAPLFAAEAPPLDADRDPSPPTSSPGHSSPDSASAPPAPLEAEAAQMASASANGEEPEPVEAQEAEEDPEGDSMTAEERASQSARDSWRRVVRHLKPTASISTAWLMQARLDHLVPGRIALRFPPNLADIVDATKHGPLVADAAREALAELWPGEWEVSFDVVRDDAQLLPQGRSLDAENAEIIQQRRTRARELITHHHIVAQAQEIFAPLEIRVVLDGEEFYTWDLT